jgi:HSP20 family molecular chaperone IbpA
MLGTSNLYNSSLSNLATRNSNPFDSLYYSLFSDVGKPLTEFVNTSEGITLDIPGVDPDLVKVTLVKGNKLKVTYPDNVKTYTFRNTIEPSEVTTEYKWGQLIVKVNSPPEGKISSEVDIPVAK